MIFGHIQTQRARIVLLDAAPKVLPTFDDTLCVSALKQLKQLDIEVKVGTKVLGVTSEGVQLENEFIRARTVVWAAGNAASPLAKELGETDRQGRIIVNEDLSVPGHPEIFAIGDVANFSHQGGKPLPGVAPFAMQSGEQAARNILAKALGNPSKTFKYWDKGSMATIGRNKAIADLKVVKLSGFLAWLSWLLIHLLFIVELRNRILIFFQWAWSYITYTHGARLSYRGFRPAVPPKEGEGTRVNCRRYSVIGRVRREMMDWSSWQPRELATLCFVRDNGRVLMIRKKRGLGAGKINGVGGRLERGESPLAGILREAQEELGITLLIPLSGANCISNFWTGTVFSAPSLSLLVLMEHQSKPKRRRRSGSISISFRSTRCGRTIELWLPQALEGKSFRGFFVFDGEKMLSKQLEWRRREEEFRSCRSSGVGE